MLAFCNAVSTFTRSSWFKLSAKKCWLTMTLSSEMQPSVLPSPWRGVAMLPEAGHEGVETCKIRPAPSSFHATMPFECPQGPEQAVEHPLICGASYSWSFQTTKLVGCL